MKVTEGNAVAENIGAEYDSPENKAKVSKSFQALLIASSTSSFMVRAPEYTDEGLQVLQKAARNVVRGIRWRGCVRGL